MGVTPESTAELMRRYTNNNFMSIERFETMAADWQFGGRPVVRDIGRRHARTFAFMPRAESTEDELHAFAQRTEEALTSANYVVHHVDDEAHEDFVADGGKTFCLSSTLGDQVCQLRLNIFNAEGKLILMSMRVWGSAVEELFMLRVLMDTLVSMWGARVEIPKALVDK